MITQQKSSLLVTRTSLTTEQTFLWWSSGRLCGAYFIGAPTAHWKKWFPTTVVCRRDSASKQCMMESSFFISSAPTGSVYMSVCVPEPLDPARLLLFPTSRLWLLYRTVQKKKTKRVNLKIWRTITPPRRSQKTSGLLRGETQPPQTDCRPFF